MTAQITDRFSAKQGRSTGRWELGASDNPLVVYLKRHYRLPFWQGLLALLWPSSGWSPAVQEWHRLRWAAERGVPVPTTVAVAEFTGPGPKLQSVLAVEQLHGMLALHEAIPLAQQELSATLFAEWKHGLVRELVRLCLLLHSAKRYHKDLYLCHFYLPERDTRHVPKDWAGRVHMIDFQRLTHHPLSWPIWQIKDLAQLLYSAEIVGVTARDRLRFWRLYLQQAGAGCRWLRAGILFKYRLYLRHNARKRRGATR